jgi:hypothetical protein
VAGSAAGGAELGRLYWRALARVTRGLVRAREDGRGLELRALGLPPALLTFAPAEIGVEDGAVSCRFAIRGGLLARRPGGSLTVFQTGDAQPQLAAVVTGFFPRLGARAGRPRWRGALYELVQERLHVAVSRRYFGLLLEEPRP